MYVNWCQQQQQQPAPSYHNKYNIIILILWPTVFFFFFYRGSGSDGDRFFHGVQGRRSSVTISTYGRSALARTMRRAALRRVWFNILCYFPFVSTFFLRSMSTQQPKTLVRIGRLDRRERLLSLSDCERPGWATCQPILYIPCTTNNVKCWRCNNVISSAHWSRCITHQTERVGSAYVLTRARHTIGFFPVFLSLLPMVFVIFFYFFFERNVANTTVMIYYMHLEGTWIGFRCTRVHSISILSSNWTRSIPFERNNVFIDFYHSVHKHLYLVFFRPETIEKPLLY